MNTPIQFEHSVAELEDIVRQLEQGDLALEDALKQFEIGITLARRCQEVLQQAELKIETLTNLHTPSDLEENGDD